MSAPPPPSFGPSGGTPPPPPWANQSLQPGPAPSGGSNTPKIIAAFVAVAVLAGGGVFLATRNSDGKKAVTVKTTPENTDSSDATEPSDTAVATTFAPTTTALAPTTTIAATTTVATAAPTTTVPFTLPAGAVDLGNEVYIIPPAGWTSAPDASTGVTTLTDGTQKVSIQLVQRAVGEDPKALGQEYLDTTDPSLEPVSVSQSYSYPIPGGIPAFGYNFTYRTYDATVDNGTALSGGLALFQRGDGLSLVYDVFHDAAVSTMSIDSDAYAGMAATFAAAPAVGPVSQLTQAPTFRLSPRTPPIFLDGTIAFTPAPGFAASGGDGSTFAQASLDDYDFDVIKFTGQASLDGALQTAQAALTTNFSNISYNSVTSKPDLGSVNHAGVGWSGTYTANGKSIGAALDVYFDPATGNAISVVVNFYATPDSRDPHRPETSFMFTSLSDSIQVAGIQ